MEEKLSDYARMLISMSTDYLLGGLDKDVFIENLKVCSDKLTELKNKECLVF